MVNLEETMWAQQSLSCYVFSAGHQRDGLVLLKEIKKCLAKVTIFCYCNDSDKIKVLI